MPSEFKNLTVHIAYEFTDGPWGGGNQFLKALRAELRSKGIYQNNIDEADIIIVNSFHFNSRTALRKMLKNKLRDRRRPYVIHRLDGPFSIVRGKRDMTDKAVLQLNKLVADGTVFQTHWIKQNLEVKSLTGRNRYEVIGNAPDNNIFFPSEKSPSTSGKIRLITTSWSKAENKGFDTLTWLDKNLDWQKYSMKFIGNSPVSFQNIAHISPLESASLARELRKSHIFISPARNEPCSNSLLEALHCGLPALVYNGGGSPEILGEGGEVFLEPSEIPHLLSTISSDLQGYRARLSKKTIVDIANMYINFAESLLESEPKKSSLIASNLFDLIWLSGPAEFLIKLQAKIGQYWN